MNLLVTGMLLALQMSIQTVRGIVHDQEGATDMTDFHLVFLTEDGVHIIVLLEVVQVGLHLLHLFRQRLSFFHSTFLSGLLDLGQRVLDLLFQHDHLFLFFVLARVQELENKYTFSGLLLISRFFSFLSGSGMTENLLIFLPLSFFPQWSSSPAICAHMLPN